MIYFERALSEGNLRRDRAHTKTDIKAFGERG